MRAVALVALAVATLSLTACAHRKPQARACAKSMLAAAEAWSSALQTAYPDRRGHHSLVTVRMTDARGNRVSEADVWPMSGPQEPAPPVLKVRVVQDACSLKALEVTRVG